MGTRKFVVYSLIYLILVVVSVYVLDNSTYTLNLLGFSLTQPVAIWIALPIVIFVLLTIAHMLYHSLAYYKFKRNIKKDTSLYNDMAKEILLGLPSNKDFKSDLFKTSSGITKVLSPWGLYAENSVDNENLANIINVVRNVKKGEVSDLKKFKLPKDNPLFIQNEINKIQNEADYYLQILKDATNSDKLKNVAYEKLLKVGDFADIKRYGYAKLNSDEIMGLIKRYVNDELSISGDEMFDLLNQDKISKEQYLDAAIMLQNKLTPDGYKTIFEKLKGIHADADEAWVYALYELGLIDELREALNNSDPDEFTKIKTLLFLRDNSKTTSSSLFYK
ncbi:MAG: LapA family protein [Campylobacter sp.]|nr:LapA family protein [Campylobacter sp.]